MKCTGPDLAGTLKAVRGAGYLTVPFWLEADMETCPSNGSQSQPEYTPKRPVSG